mgnify:CR=1 FL=1
MTDFDYDRIAAARESLAGRVIRTPAMPLCGSKIAPYIPDNAELFIKLAVIIQFPCHLVLSDSLAQAQVMKLLEDRLSILK